MWTDAHITWQNLQRVGTGVGLCRSPHGSTTYTSCLPCAAADALRTCMEAAIRIGVHLLSTQRFTLGLKARISSLP